jgi:RimJ/RimL family protein N-acetyltransferase/adenylate kinase family enzyme
LFLYIFGTILVLSYRYACFLIIIFNFMSVENKRGRAAETEQNQQHWETAEQARETLGSLQEQLNEVMAEMRALEAEPHEQPKHKERDASRKQVLCFLGLPGAGKTTQINEIQDIIGAEVVHAGKLAKQKGVPHEAARSKGKLIEGVDEMVLDEVDGQELPYVILDGFPRSDAQAQKLLERAEQEGWDVHTLYFTFPEGQEVEASFERQMARDSVEKPGIDHTDRIVGKIKRSVEDDMSAIKRLIDEQASIHVINAEANKREITSELYEVLGMDYESKEFDEQTLRTVAKVADELGIEAWPGAGLLYRPFWNGRFGPAQESTDKDVHVDSPENARTLLKRLQEVAPHVRWAVDDRMQDTREFYGIESPDLATAMQTFPLTFREGGVRFKDGKLDVMMSEQAERDIRRGILRIDEELLARVPEEWHQKIIDRSLERAVKMLGEYPALRIEGRLKDVYERQYGTQEPSRITVDWERIQDEVWEQEYGGRQTWYPERFTDSDKVYGEKIRQHYINADKRLTAPPRPDFHPLPEPLELVRKRKLAVEMGEIDPNSEEARIPETINPPEGYSTWLHFMATEQEDGPFKEWFLNQVRSRKPIGGKDPDVKKAIDITKEDKPKKGEQKATHMGFPLDKHTQEAVLQTSTDWLAEDDSLSDQEKRRYRTCMRMAMLYHDHGKLHNVHTPGSHEGIGAKIWEKNAPEWMDKQDIALTKWMIQTHDVFGRLARGLTEKKDIALDDEQFDPSAEPSYQGALDPVAVRQYLRQSDLPLETAAKLHHAIWRSDVSSVSALRWVLPISEHLRDMVLESDTPEERIAEPIHTETERMMLRSSTADDAQAMNDAIAASQTSLGNFLGRWATPPPPLKKTQEFLRKADEKRRDGEGQHVVGYNKENDEFVLSLGLNPKGEGSYEIGGWVNEKYQASGMAPEASQALIEHAFTVLDAKQVETRMKPDNVPSQRASEKAGFTFVGEIERPSKSKPGETVIEYQYVLSREEWMKRKNK